MERKANSAPQPPLQRAFWSGMVFLLTLLTLLVTPALAATHPITIDVTNDANQSPVFTTFTDPRLADPAVWNEFKWARRTYPLLGGHTSNKSLPTVHVFAEVPNGNYWVFANLFGKPDGSFRYYYSYGPSNPSAYSVDVGPQADCAETELLQVTVADGQFDMYIQKADVTSGTEDYFGWAWVRLVPIDTAAPRVTLTPPAYYPRLTKVTINAADAPSDVDHIEYRVNGARATLVDRASATVTFTKLGRNTLEYRAADTAGNFSNWESATVTVLYSPLTMYAPTTSAYRSAHVYGYLKYAGPTGALLPLPGMHVDIQHYSGGAWRTIARVETSPNGRYDYTAAPMRKTAYRARYYGDATYLAQDSAPVYIRPRLSLGRPSFGRAKLAYRRTYAAFGYMKPRHGVGSREVKIKAYRYEGGRYVYKRTYAAKASKYLSYSKYRASIKLPRRGTWRLRAYHVADSLNASTFSAYRYVKVK